MLSTNPFPALTVLLSPTLLQGYLVIMALLVLLGTAFDLLHDSKARFFLQDREQAKARAKRDLGLFEVAAITFQTLLVDIATFGEFCNWRRRLSHALMFYGFVLYLSTTVVMIFFYPADPVTPVVLPMLWNIGVLMTLVGGYWFFFFLRVNVVHDGHSLWRLERSDLFIVTLLASMTSAFLLAAAQMAGSGLAFKIIAGLYAFFTTLFFASVPWSKFAHMFYKPVVAFQKRVEEADGSSNLPTPTTTRGERCPHSHT